MCRTYLKDAILLRARGTDLRRRFTIVKPMENGEGASSVCYEAYHDDSGRGVLKEFYPKAYALERDEHGQLVLPEEWGDARERFMREQQEYVEPYDRLLAAKQNGDEQDLATFIPAFEIYHGCDEAGEIVGSTYVWTPYPKLETFDKICDEIHQHPEDRPEHKLVTVLMAIRSLAKCVCALHSMEMIHRDIKPSNFGFVRRGGETLTQALTMFDLNSICDLYAGDQSWMGTKGYMEPEAYEKNYSLDSKTDIYSIGVTLFHAIVITDETRQDDFRYRDAYYKRLRRMVQRSELIQASEANSRPELVESLAAILKKCLCRRSLRYQNCDELVEALDGALDYVVPSEVLERRRPGEQWNLAELEKVLDRNKGKNSMMAIQYHLYEHPLYESCMTKEDASIRVLVLGFGKYGQRFLDACLQAGQMRDKKLIVTVVSGEEEDKETYLAGRPELSEFFNIDKSLEGRDDAYGDVRFEVAKLPSRKQEGNDDALLDVLGQYCEEEQSYYVFIALGDDEFNDSVASNCLTLLSEKCVISYVCERKQAPRETTPRLYPVFVNAPISKTSLYAEIERMAFNTHLVWEPHLNVDYRAVRRNFRKPYNHDSSVASVLSLKYKLHSMGIELGEVDFAEAASQFIEKLSDRKGLKNELIWIEHRRWVTEKLCLGWRRLRDLEECAGGATKDEKRKRHICMVRSRTDQNLATDFKDFDKWDTASDSELDGLDELDRMSVELHRMYAAKAKEAMQQDLLSEHRMAAIRSLIERDRKALAAYQEWLSCLRSIWQKDSGKVRLYEGLKRALLRATEHFPVNQKIAVREQVNAFEKLFYPILASMEYKIWKQEDVKQIDHIPFVLTYRENVCMAIPYATGDANRVFENVAAPLFAAPKKILYLYRVEKAQDIRDLLSSIPCVMEFMKKKRIRASVEFVVACVRGAVTLHEEDFEKEIRSIAGKRVTKVKCVWLDDTVSLSEGMEAYLRQRSTDKAELIVEKNGTDLSGRLQETRFYSKFPHYKFHSDTMRFEALSGCEMMCHIRQKPFITVSDMLAFRLSTSENSDQPEFFHDYQALWNVYREKRALWFALCGILSDYAKEHDVLATFSKPRMTNNVAQPQEYSYILPYACVRSARKIVDVLKREEIIGQESCVNGYTTDSCQVTIYDRYRYRVAFDKLFSNVYVLMISDDALNVYLNTKSHEVVVAFDQLVVSDVQLPKDKLSGLANMLNFFRNRWYVINLVITEDGRASFAYASRKIKELLTTAGKILEVYTYHKLKELGRFDDVVSGCEVNWGGEEDIKSEFDCILTKGFRTLFVECKARYDIEQEFYFKLAPLVKQFGINATAVLVADTMEQGYEDRARVNAMQRQRGEMLDVVTIWKPEEITNIGQTLLKVINGEYGREER